MSRNKGNGIIGWTIAIADMALACLLLPVFFHYFPGYAPPAILHGIRSSMVVMCISVVITSFITPSVIYRRKLSVDEIVKRNVFAVGLEVFIFCTVCRLMTRAGNFIMFGVIFWLLLCLVILISRFFERQFLNMLRERGRNSRSVLFVGSDPANMMVYKELASSPATGYRVMGYYSDGVMENVPEEMKKLGSRADLKEIMKSGEGDILGVDELYCSLSHRDSADIREIMEFCDKNVIHFYYVPRIFGNLQLSLRPEVFGNSVLYTNHHEPLQNLNNRILKRAFDVIFSSVVLIVLLPFLPVIALMIKLQSPGPLIFKQERTGLNGQSFICYKFRSMHVNANADKVQATKDDPRKFAFGNFMRKTNIDEFPQFFNVLRGDMSIVGPRPHMVFHTEKYSSLIDKYMVRHFSKPGITGYAQVTGFRGETEQLWQMEGRIQKDIWYIENWSLWLDIKIIFLTAWSVIHPDKAAY